MQEIDFLHYFIIPKKLKYSRSFLKKMKNKKIKTMPHLPLLSAENKKNDEIKRIPHRDFDLFMLI